MPLFVYKALNKFGAEENGEVQALNRRAAIEYLQRNNFTPTYLEEKGKVSRSRFSQFELLTERKISALDKVFLTRHLAAILKSGIDLREALEILEGDIANPMTKKILRDAKKNLERGQPLSSTFENYEKHFSPVFVGLIKAGEASGTLEETLERIGEQLEKEYDLKKKVQSAMIYPLILMGASSLIIILLLTFVMPRLIKALTQAKMKLPLITRFFIEVSKILSASPAITIILFFGIIISAILFFKSVKGKEILFLILERLPVSRELIKKLALARFSTTLRNLLRSGVPALEAFDITAKTIGNKRYEKALSEIKEELKKGSPLFEVFRKRENLFPHLVVSVIGVGERTGTLEQSLSVITNYYNEEVERLLKNLITLLEPLLLIIMGFIIAGIALSILLPIYQLVSSFR